MAERPPLGMAVLFLVALHVAYGLSPMPEASYTSFSRAQAFVQALQGSLILTLVTLLLVRRLQGRGGFEGTFCVLVFSKAPWLAGPLLLPVAQQHWLVYQFYLLVQFGTLLWSVILLGIGVSVVHQLPAARACVAVLPACGLLLIAATTGWTRTPAPLQAAQEWRRYDGQRVSVFYPPGRDRGEVAEVGRMCDRMLVEVSRAFQVPPPSFRVKLFLFRTERLHAQAVPEKREEFVAAAQGRSVSMVYAPSAEIEPIVAHEFAHVVAHDQFGGASGACPVLAEGLAEYLAAKTAGDGPGAGGAEQAWLTDPVPLRALAAPELFYDLQPLEGAYAQAHGWVGYLIRRGGLDNLKRLYRETSVDDWRGNAVDRFAEAVLKVYGAPLERLEEEWREAGPLPESRILEGALPTPVIPHKRKLQDEKPAP